MAEKYTELKLHRTNLRDSIPLDMPFTLFVDPSNFCNFKCSFCPRNQDDFVDYAGAYKHMSINLFSKIVDDLQAFKGRLKVLRLFYLGEPLLCPDFFKILELACAKYVAERIEISTNASLLTEKCSKKILQIANTYPGNLYLRISIYSVYQQKNEMITKNDISVQEAYYYEDEIRFVINEIASLVNHNGYEYKDIAVLYRNSALSRNFELAFIQEHIPYNIYGSFAFLKRKEVKDIISYLRFIASPTKMLHFKRIINVPARGVGDKTIEKLQEYMHETNCDILGSIDIFKERNSTSKADALLEFKKIMVELMDDLNKMSLSDFFDTMLEKTGYLDWLKANEENDEVHRVENVKEFKSILYQLDNDNLNEGLTNVEKIEIGLDELLLDTTMVDDHQQNGVVLSTVHSVKGLEFRAVFVVGLEEGIFPAIRDEADIEEERRVAYVAFTRAKEKLYITCSTSRLIYGRVVRNPKSRFLMELLSASDKKEQATKQNENKPTGEIELGSRVNHKYFGNGLVIAKDDRFIQILFDKDQSIKKIAKDHPTITKLDS